MTDALDHKGLEVVVWSHDLAMKMAAKDPWEYADVIRVRGLLTQVQSLLSSQAQEMERLTRALDSVASQADNAAWNIGKPGHKFTPADIQAGYFSIRDFARQAINQETSHDR